MSTQQKPRKGAKSTRPSFVRAHVRVWTRDYICQGCYRLIHHSNISALVCIHCTPRVVCFLIIFLLCYAHVFLAVWLLSNGGGTAVVKIHHVSDHLRIPFSINEEIVLGNMLLLLRLFRFELTTGAHGFTLTCCMQILGSIYICTVSTE